jgi:hypothetical protein
MVGEALMRLATVPDGTLGCDTYDPMSDTDCMNVIGRGCKFVVRYLDNLTKVELLRILGHGLIVFFVHSCRAPGWTPNMADGAQDGHRDVRLLQALGIPTGVHITFDLEGAAPGTALLVMQHVNAHGQVVKAMGYLPSLYLGDACQVNAQQAYAMVSVLYWRSCSYVTSEPQCGYAMVQAYKPDQVVNGTEVDFDMAMSDYKNRTMIGVAA